MSPEHRTPKQRRVNPILIPLAKHQGAPPFQSPIANLQLFTTQVGLPSHPSIALYLVILLFHSFRVWSILISNSPAVHKFTNLIDVVAFMISVTAIS